MSENGTGKKVREIAINKLKAGEQPFLAWGYSYLRAMRLVELTAEDQDGNQIMENDRLVIVRDSDGNPMLVEEEVTLKVRIKSVGVSEVSDRIARKAPVPPTTKEYVKMGTDEAKALGLTHPKIAIIENFADPTFKEDLRKHGQRTVYSAVLAGLAMDVEDVDGTLVVKSNGHNKATEIVNEDRAIEILKGQGISNAQFDQLYEDIQNLTQREVARVDRE